MGNRNLSYFMSYISPNGSTRRVAETLREALQWNGQAVHEQDLTKQSGSEEFRQALDQAGASACLLIGSPVYRDQAPPPIMTFLDNLAKTKGAWAVPFVTWGTACSGVALWQLGSTLMQKGFRLAAGLKVAAVHSLMWDAEKPAGLNHPDEKDRQTIENLVSQLIAKTAVTEAAPLSLATLDYQPADRSREAKAKLTQPWMVAPKKIDQEACTQCGICAEICPVDAVELSPYPVIKAHCFDCFNCVRLCPENAIQPAMGMEKIHGMIRDRVNTIGEQPLTRFFI